MLLRPKLQETFLRVRQPRQPINFFNLQLGRKRCEKLWNLILLLATFVATKTLQDVHFWGCQTGQFFLNLCRNEIVRQIATKIAWCNRALNNHHSILNFWTSCSQNLLIESCTYTTSFLTIIESLYLEWTSTKLCLELKRASLIWTEFKYMHENRNDEICWKHGPLRKQLFIMISTYQS